MSDSFDPLASPPGDPLLSGLSDEQREVVLAPPGPLLVLAGAGSGKTRALTQRVAYFLHHGVAPEHILLVTFTNLAARQMIARLAAQAERSLEGMWAGTFHHLAVRVLRRHGFRIGLPERFVILDRSDAADLLGSCLGEAPPPAGLAWPRATLLQSLLSLSINVEAPLDEIVAAQAPELRPLLDGGALGKVCDRYTLRKLQLGLCDFDDLLLGWRLLLCDHKVVRDEQREQFQHLFIDEYQDTSRIQSALCEDIAQGYRSLTVVGDDAQSIYRFRGAALSNLQEFRVRWPDARVLHLSTNYRSQPAIVALSNRSIARNAAPSGVPRPPMRSGLTDSAPATAMRPAVVGLPDARLQAAFVLKRLGERLADGRSPSEIAILYRSHRHARELELELLRAQIPYSLRSGQRMSEQAHVKDVLAFLRLCHNPRDRLSWARVLRQVFGLGDVGRSRVLAALDEQLSRGGAMPDVNDRVLRHARGDSRRGLYRLFALLAELREMTRASTTQRPEKLVESLLEHVLARHYRDYARRAFADAEQRLRDLDGLCHGSAQTGAPRGFDQGVLPLQPSDALCDFLSGPLDGEGAAGGAKKGGIVLSTVHQAKGLEWSVVFVLWLCEGHFPAAPARDDEEEERRLFYVAVTRAKQELYLCYPSAAPAHGALRRSRFLDELEGPRGEKDPPFERWAVLT